MGLAREMHGIPTLKALPVNIQVLPVRSDMPGASVMKMSKDKLIRKNLRLCI